MKHGTGLDDLPLLSSSQAARLILVSRTSLYAREQEGWIKRVGPDQWCAVDVVHGNVRYLQDRAKRASQTGTLSRVQEARARSIERKNLVAEGKLMDVDVVMADTVEIFGWFASRLEGFPAQITRDLVLRQAMKEGLDKIRHEVADRCEARAAEHMAKAEAGGSKQ
jgi:hypothetical protein